MASSLSSVVSDLVRTQKGTSVPSSVTDEELDRHVADLIVREAKKRAELYMQTGIRAYTTNNLIDNNAPRTNKRFLSSIIKSTDEHNRTILKAQAQSAEDLKRERREHEKKQRKMRAEEAAAAKRSWRNGKRSHVDDDECWDRWDGRTAERKHVSRNWESWNGHDDIRESGSNKKHSRKRRRSRSGEHTRTDEERVRRPRSTSSDREYSSPRRKYSPRPDLAQRDGRIQKRRRDHEGPHRNSRHSERHSRSSSVHGSDSENYKVRKQSHRQSPSPRQRDVTTESREELKQRLKNSRNEGLGSSRDTYVIPATPSRSSSASPRQADHVPSKMDRYFEDSYDPRLDVEPLVLPQVPATGLISDADFEGWDAMLELIRLRREDKVEKKRLERLGVLPTKEKSRKSILTNSSAAVAERWNDQGASVMNIEYNKKGTVREWDLGKSGF